MIRIRQNDVYPIGSGSTTMPLPGTYIYETRPEFKKKKTYPPDEVRPWDWSQAYLQSPYHLSKSEEIQLRKQNRKNCCRYLRIIIFNRSSCKYLTPGSRSSAISLHSCDSKQVINSENNASMKLLFSRRRRRIHKKIVALKNKIKMTN